MRSLLLGLSLVCAAAAADPDFVRDVRPLLAKRCFGCHGPALQKSHLRLDRRADALHGGESGVPAIVPGKSGESLLIRYVSGTDAKLVMPPAGPRLKPEEVAVLKTWIDAGAEWPGDTSAAIAPKADPRLAHWAFHAPKQPAIPPVKNSAWVRNPIDAFVLAKLEAKGWQPAPRAKDADLLRRMYLDITGLPPTLEEQDSFRGDWDGLSRELLARGTYGERWARHWLDVVRYGDTNGYERDAVKPSGWKFRDYVIRSLNNDKSFQRFVLEQLAGDELPDSDAETLLATGYARLGPWDDEPADPAEDRFDQLDDILNTTSQGFLGLTLACARCHNHKFEPLTTKDYYGMIAVFNGLDRPRDGRTELDRPIGKWPEIARFNEREAKIKALRDAARLAWLQSGQSKLAPEAVAAFLQAPKDREEAARKLVRDSTKALDAELAALPVEEEVARLKRETPDLPRGYFMEERSATPPATHILIRGKASSPGPEVPPSVPTLLVKEQPSFAADGMRTSGRRLAFARWVASRENPLTARVIVNRVWQAHFGEGIVRTANDFGVMGDKPSHEELIDWLAVWFMDNGWSLKKLHALILGSNTFRMSKTSNAKYAAEDPENRLLWRMPYRRLEAEAILDSALAVSGKLNRTMYGEFVYPKVQKEALEGSSDPDKIWAPFTDENKASRRAIYYIVKRSLMVPLMEVLDLCDTTRPSAKRQTTSVAPQALQLFNGDFVNRQAKHFAARLREEAGPAAEAQIERAYRLALARKPTEAERTAMTAFLRQSSLEEMCRVILNLNEFAYAN
ncbi:MAG TPA: PSD1 and planctomycete cytochrome C domain-containing protein [Bryobacteraceae bacterium]|nr:PSD1 and planctomycete cytochrome C domain-containing protein [Bryobacteraceae bacterium]